MNPWLPLLAQVLAVAGFTGNEMRNQRALVAPDEEIEYYYEDSVTHTPQNEQNHNQYPRLNGQHQPELSDNRQQVGNSNQKSTNDLNPETNNFYPRETNRQYPQKTNSQNFPVKNPIQQIENYNKLGVNTLSNSQGGGKQSIPGGLGGYVPDTNLKDQTDKRYMKNQFDSYDTPNNQIYSQGNKKSINMVDQPPANKARQPLLETNQLSSTSSSESNIQQNDKFPNKILHPFGRKEQPLLPSQSRSVNNENEILLNSVGNTFGKSNEFSPTPPTLTNTYQNEGSLNKTLHTVRNSNQLLATPLTLNNVQKNKETLPETVKNKIGKTNHPLPTPPFKINNYQNKEPPYKNIRSHEESNLQGSTKLYADPNNNVEQRFNSTRKVNVASSSSLRPSNISIQSAEAVKEKNHFQRPLSLFSQSLKFKSKLRSSPKKKVPLVLISKQNDISLPAEEANFHKFINSIAKKDRKSDSDEIEEDDGDQPNNTNYRVNNNSSVVLKNSNSISDSGKNPTKPRLSNFTKSVSNSETPQKKLVGKPSIKEKFSNVNKNISSKSTISEDREEVEKFTNGLRKGFTTPKILNQMRLEIMNNLKNDFAKNISLKQIGRDNKNGLALRNSQNSIFLNSSRNAQDKNAIKTEAKQINIIKRVPGNIPPSENTLQPILVNISDHHKSSSASKQDEQNSNSQSNKDKKITPVSTFRSDNLLRPKNTPTFTNTQAYSKTGKKGKSKTQRSTYEDISTKDQNKLRNIPLMEKRQFTVTDKNVSTGNNIVPRRTNIHSGHQNSFNQNQKGPQNSRPLINKRPAEVIYKRGHSTNETFKTGKDIIVLRNQSEYGSLNNRKDSGIQPPLVEKKQGFKEIKNRNKTTNIFNINSLVFNQYFYNVTSPFDPNQLATSKNKTQYVKRIFNEKNNGNGNVKKDFQKLPINQKEYQTQLHSNTKPNLIKLGKNLTELRTNEIEQQVTTNMKNQNKHNKNQQSSKKEHKSSKRPTTDELLNNKRTKNITPKKRKTNQNNKTYGGEKNYDIHSNIPKREKKQEENFRNEGYDDEINDGNKNWDDISQEDNDIDIDDDSDGWNINDEQTQERKTTKKAKPGRKTETRYPITQQRIKSVKRSPANKHEIITKVVRNRTVTVDTKITKKIQL